MALSDHFWKTWLTLGDWVDDVRESISSPRGSKARSLELSELEERILLSAAPMMMAEQTAVVPQDAEDGSDASLGDTETHSSESDSELIEQSELAPTNETARQELVFIDTTVEDYEALLADLENRDDADRNLDVVLLDADRNGIEQITETLARYKEASLEGIHFVTHGTDRAVKLGNTWLDSQAFEEHRPLIETWSFALDSDADLLFYGCDFAANETGQTLLNDIADVTGADVAASTDVTGAAILGGDWVLEFQIGQHETELAFSRELHASWLQTLDITTNLLLHNTFDTDASDSSGNGYDGTLENGAVIDTNAGTNQIGGGKVSLDGTNDYVDLSTHVANFQNLGEGTIAAWVYADVNDFGIIFETSDSVDTDSRAALFRSNDGSLVFFVNEGNTTLLDVSTGAGTIPLNTWVHVAITVNASGNQLYVNGSQVVGGLTYNTGSATTSAFFDDVADLDFLGWGVDHFNNTSFGAHFDGFLDDGRVYDRALSSSDITELFTARDDIVATATNQGGLNINTDGGNDVYLQADDGGAIVGGLGQVTLETSFRFNSAPSGSIALLSYAEGANDEALGLFISNTGQLLFTANSTGTAQTSATTYTQLFDGQQHHLAVSWDNTNGAVTFYIDGALVESFTGYQNGQTIGTGGVLVLGNDQDSPGGDFAPLQSFSGTLFDVCIFDDVRSDAEIAASYQSDLPFDEPNLIANWKFNQLSRDGIVTDTVSGNNLTVQHASGTGFVASTPSLTLAVDETVTNGTVIGQVSGTDAERDALIASLLAADSDLVYSEETGKFYKAVSTSTDWTNASTQALATNLNSEAGQLATIRSAAEQEIVANIVSTLGTQLWLGGSDASIEGEWRWQEDGANQDHFWQGDETGYNIDDAYVNWLSGRPDNSGGVQHYLFIRTDGFWNDEVINHPGTGYLIEWDADAVLDATQALTYSVQSQTVSGAFEVDTDTGEVRVADGSLLDADTQAIHTVTIRTTDVDANTFDQAFTVSLNNLTEANNAPTNLSSGIELNTDGGNDAYLVTSSGATLLGGLSQFTTEIRFAMENLTNTAYLTSYATTEHSDSLRIGIHTGGEIRLLINGSRVDSTAMDYSTLADGVQHTLSVTWDNSLGRWEIFVDGELVDHGTGLETGSTLNATNGTLVYGNEQDSIDGGYDLASVLSATLYDVRIWNEVRSEPEISLNYQHKLDTGSLPSGLIANWQMDGFNGSNVVDVVSGNNLSIRHATGTGFISSDPVEDLHISESAADGTGVGFVLPSDPDAPQDVIHDGLFQEAGSAFGNPTYHANGSGAGSALGDWTVTSGSVDLIGNMTIENGGSAIDLNGDEPGAISQTVTTIAGRQYQIIFDVTGNFSGGAEPVKTLRISADGTSQDFQIEQPSGWNFTTNPLFETRSTTFTADDTSTTISFAGTNSDNFGAVITNIRVVEIPQAVTTILNNDSTLTYDAATGNFYRAVSANLVWDDALTAATSATLNGVSGQLVVILSANENAVVSSLVAQLNDDVWLGGSDAATEGEWRWYNGTSPGDQFWQGNASGSAIDGFFNNWGAGEPSDSDTDRDYLEFDRSSHIWQAEKSTQQNSYIIEWDASEVLSTFTFAISDPSNNFQINNSTGEITLAATSTLNFETATFHDVDVTVTDASGNSYMETMRITVDDVPGIGQTLPAAQTTNEDTAITFSAANGNAITVDDGTVATDTRLQVRLTVDGSNGIITLSQITGLTFPGGSNASSSMVIWGTEADINAALDGAVFTPNGNYNGSENITVETKLAADLQAEYTFEDGTANDTSVGVTQNGTLVNDAAVTTDAERGQVLSLDGDTDYVDLSAHVGDFAGFTQGTISGWINSTGTRETIFSISDTTDSNSYAALMLDSSGFLTYEVSENNVTLLSVSKTDVALNDGTWHHVAVTVGPTGNKFYVDGVEVTGGQLTYNTGDASTQHFFSSVTNANAMAISNTANSSGDRWNVRGAIDDIRVYNAVLSADSLAAIAADEHSVTGTVPITINAVNDDPVNNGSLPSDVTVLEDTSGFIDLSAIDLEDVDAGNKLISVILRTSAGGRIFAGDDSDVTVFGSGFSIVQFSGSVANLNTFFNVATQIQYFHGTPHTNGDNADVITVEVNDLGNTGSGGGGTISLGTVNVDITPRNDAPVNIAPASVSTPENTTLAFTGANQIQISDVDAGSSEMRVQLNVGAGGLLSLGTITNLAFDAGNGMNDANMIFRGTINDINNALLTLTFDPTANFTGAVNLAIITNDQGNTGQDPGLTGDGTSEEDTDVVVITVTAVNDAPTISLSPGTPNYIENGPAIILDAAATVSDTDSADFDTGTLTVDFMANGTANDRLSIRNQGTGSGQIGVIGSSVTYEGNNIGTFTGGTDGSTPLVVTLNTNATVAATQALIQNITFNNVSENPNQTARIARFVLTDGDGGTSTAVTKGVDVQGVNDNPLVSNLDGDALTYNEGDGAVILEQGGNATVTDVDSPNFSGGSLTVELDGGLIATEDVISIRNQGTNPGEIGVSGSDVTYGGVIIGTFTGGTGVTPLTVNFNSNATTAAATALVRNLTYENTNLADPTTGMRSVVVDVTDGDGGASLTQNLTINVVAINDAPVADLNGSDGGGVDYSTTFTEGDMPVNITDADATITDLDHSAYIGLGINLAGFVDGTGELIRVNGELFVNTTSRVVTTTVGSTTFELDFDGSGFTISRDGGGTMPEADLQALLRTMTYENISLNPTDGNRTLNVIPQDAGGLNGVAAVSTISITSLLDPTVSLPSGAVNYTENDAATILDVAATVSDADSSNFATGTLTIDFTANGTANDRLTIRNEGTGSGQIGISGFNATYEGIIIGSFMGGTDGSTPLVITLNSNADQTATQALLRNITYENVSENPSELARTVRFVLTDGDGGTSNAATKTINVIAENDAPQISTSTVFRSYNENATPITVDPSLSISDVDHINLTSAVVQITGNFQAGQDVLSFTNQLGIIGNYNAMTGVLSLSGTSSIANYQTALRSVTYHNTSEDPSIAARTFTFVADDGIDRGNLAMRDLSIVSINDRPVTDDVSATGNEDATSIAITLTGSDVDGTVTEFQLTSLPTHGVLYTDTGLTMLATTGVDYAATGEALTLYFVPNTDFNGSTSFQYIAKDAGGLADQTPATATITVNAINDDPVITSNGGGATATININENTTAVTTVTSTDIDGGTPSYSIIGGVDQTRFQIGSITGELTFITAPDFGTPTDVDTNNIYEVTVQVRDGNGGTDTQAISITVVDQNNNAPVIDPGQIFSVSESAGNSASVGSVIATDADTVGTLQNWQIISGKLDSIFAIDSATGEITIADNTNLDFETTNNYTLTLTVSDGVNTSASETVAISILNVNEFAISSITDVDGATNQVLENQSAGSPVGVTANASDGDTSDVVRYSLDDDAGGLFTINSNNGVVTTTATLDAETATSYTIIVRADSSDGSFATRSFTINVVDIDEFDASNITDQDPTMNQIVESAAIGTPVGLTAFAEDLDVTDQILYSLDDNASGRFTIDASTGVVTLANTVDFETATSHDIIIRATSTDGSFQIRTFSIAVLDANDVPPVIAPNQFFPILDEANVGTSLGFVQATDADSVGTLQNWRFIGGNDQGFFAIDPNTGEITLAQPLGTDFQSQDRFTLTVIVEDGQNVSAAETILIQIFNINDAPQLDLSRFTLTYQENDPPLSLDPGLMVLDRDSLTLISATIQLSGNYQVGEDRLAFQNQLGITGTFDLSTGTLTLTGAASLGDYQAALRTVTYENLSENPSALARTISLTLFDGALSSSTSEISLVVDPVNDPPVIIVPSNQLVENTDQIVFSRANGNAIVLSDVDSDGIFTLTISSTNGRLTLATFQGLTFLQGDGTNDSEVRVTGLLGDLNQALDGLSFTQDSSNSNTAGLSFLLEDTASNVSQITLESLSVSFLSAAPASTPTVIDSSDNSDRESEQEEITVDLASVELATSSRSDIQTTSATITPTAVAVVALTPTPALPPVGEELIAPPPTTSNSLTRNAEATEADRDTNSDERERKPRKEEDSQNNERVARRFSNEPFNSEKLFDKLNTLGEQLEQQEKQDAVVQTLVAGTTAMVAGSLTVGYMIWVLRAGSLMATMLSYLPAWVFFDPLPILDSFQDLRADDSEGPEDSLSSMITGANS